MPPRQLVLISDEQIFSFRHILEEHGVGGVEFQYIIDHPDRFVSLFRDPEVLEVMVDFRLSVSEMIAAGQFGWVNPQIAEVRCPIAGAGVAKAVLELVYRGQYVKSQEVIGEFSRRNLQPARFEHLLALAAQYPELQQQFPIAILTSDWEGKDGSRYVFCIGQGARGRYLSFREFDRLWRGYWRFLGLRE